MCETALYIQILRERHMSSALSSRIRYARNEHCEQFIRHQTVKRMQARSEHFYTRVVHALLHTCVCMKFKSSCTVHS